MRYRGVVGIIATSALLIAGCDVSKPPPPGGAAGGSPAAAGSGGTQAPPGDVFAAAAADAEQIEKPFYESSRPFLTALAARNYSAAYDQLSSHCKAKMFSGQFTPSAATETSLGTPIENLTREQFIEWMGKTEAELGTPEGIRDVSVFETDPQVLSGKGDRLSVSFAIGAMPESVPAGIRRASIRAGLNCKPTRAWAEAIAKDLEKEVTADQILEGKVDQETKETLEENQPYLNLKFVLVEEGGGLKVGYVDFSGPSILD